jgi:hypothetical protein
VGCGVPYAFAAVKHEDGGRRSGREETAMITAGPVTVVVNGAIVGGFAPARIRHGRVIAPLEPIVVRIVSRAVYDAAAQTVTLERAQTRITVPVLLVENDVPYVELGPIVRDIGGSVAFDSPSKTLTIIVNGPTVIATPAPFDPNAPRVEPNPVFTPQPPRPTPRSTETGEPRPRRTAIPAPPSQPVPAPEAGPTDPRR